MPRTPPDVRERGAHFLAAASPVVPGMVGAADLQPGERVLDVGAGRGAFTGVLCAAVGPTGHVTAIEIDPGLARRLAERTAPNATVVQGDALAVPYPKPLDAVVSNPPYRILAPLLLRLADHGFGRAILVLPRELLDRLRAAPGTDAYGPLTARLAVRLRAEPLFPIPRRAFDPPPAVASVAARLEPAPAPGLDLALHDLVVATAWARRRRTNRHALAPLAKALGVPPQTVTDALRAAEASETAPWSTAPSQFAAIARHLQASRTGRRPEGRDAHR